jgi:hypothetical protein
MRRKTGKNYAILFIMQAQPSHISFHYFFGGSHRNIRLIDGNLVSTLPIRFSQRMHNNRAIAPARARTD